MLLLQGLTFVLLMLKRKVVLVNENQDNGKNGCFVLR